jgi:perosamine synthetase
LGKQIKHNQLIVKEFDFDLFSEIINSGQWAGGIFLNRMEVDLSKRFDTLGAVGVSSGLSALRLALLSLGIGPGDQVVLPAYSCVALANAILSVGAIPTPVDIRLDTYNIDPDAISRSRTNNTKAAIVVNTFGEPAEVEKIKSMGIRVIEDCSHGFTPSNSNPDQIGVVRGDVAIFSFYATKLIPGGEGGALLSNDKAILEFASDFRDYTDKAPNGLRLNDKLTDIAAALISSQLKILAKKIAERNRIAEFYNNALQDCREYLWLPKIDGDRVWYRFAPRLLKHNAVTVVEQMGNKGVTAAIPVSMWLGSKNILYKNSNVAYKSALSLPLYPGLERGQTEFVIKCLKELLN